MKIAICDDEHKELNKITGLLKEYQKIKNEAFTYESFTSASSLLEKMQTDTFDLLFLDVIMPVMSGMEAAHNIRSFNNKVKIVFLTSSPEFAVESYHVEASNYLLKPINKRALFSTLDKLLHRMQQENECVAIKCKTGIVRLMFSKLCYVEVLGKTLSFHMSDGASYVTTSALSDFEDTILARPEFIRVHRSFIVNLWRMKALNARSFTSFSNATIPISRRFYTDVKETFMMSLFTKKEEIEQ